MVENQSVAVEILIDNIGDWLASHDGLVEELTLAPAKCASV